MEQLDEIVSIKPADFVSFNLMKLTCAKSGQLCEGSTRNIYCFAVKYLNNKHEILTIINQ